MLFFPISKKLDRIFFPLLVPFIIIGEEVFKEIIIFTLRYKVLTAVWINVFSKDVLTTLNFRKIFSILCTVPTHATTRKCKKHNYPLVNGVITRHPHNHTHVLQDQLTAAIHIRLNLHAGNKSQRLSNSI